MIFDKIIRHLYMTLLLLSGVAMTILGGYYMVEAGESYGSQEALAAVAMHEVKQLIFPNENEDASGELIDIAALGGESVTDDGSDDALDDDYDEFEEADDSEDGSAEEAEETAEDSQAGSAEVNDGTEEVTEVPENQENTEETAVEEKESSSSAAKKKKKWRKVNEDYFDDALFIGDSRQQGFGMYSGLENITCYAQKSFTSSMIATKPLVDTPFGKITLVDALAIEQHKYKKVYIMFGLNDMASISIEDMDRYFYNLIDYVKLTQPSATVYLESIIHVSAVEERQKPIFSNDKIDERNKHLKKIAKKEGIVYLNLNEIFTDENNCLFADAASDGVHLKAQYIEQWKEFLMKHAVYPDNRIYYDKKANTYYDPRGGGYYYFEDGMFYNPDTDEHYECILPDKIDWLPEDFKPDIEGKEKHKQKKHDDEDRDASDESQEEQEEVTEEPLWPEDGYAYMELTPQQLLLKKQLDYYNEQLALQLSQGVDAAIAQAYAKQAVINWSTQQGE